MVLSTQHSTRRSRNPRSLGGTAQSVYIATADVDGLHQRAADAGAEIFNPLRDTDHGREFCCLDPEATFGPSEHTDRRPRDRKEPCSVRAKQGGLARRI
jgi:hypothetical protein